MRRFVIVFLLALAVGSGLMLATWSSAFSSTSRSKPGVMIDDFREITRLGLLELPVSGVEPVENRNWCGGVEMIISYRGWLQAGVDLDTAHLEQGPGGCTLYLSKPRIMSAGLADSEPRVLSISRWGLWHAVPGSGIEQRLFQRGLELASQRLTEVPLSEQWSTLCRSRIESAVYGFGRARGIEVDVVWE